MISGGHVEHESTATWSKVNLTTRYFQYGMRGVYLFVKAAGPRCLRQRAQGVVHVGNTMQPD